MSQLSRPELDQLIENIQNDIGTLENDNTYKKPIKISLRTAALAAVVGTLCLVFNLAIGFISCLVLLVAAVILALTIESRHLEKLRAAREEYNLALATRIGLNLNSIADSVAKIKESSRK